jgi:hypothetical protein
MTLILTLLVIYHRNHQMNPIHSDSPKAFAFGACVLSAIANNVLITLRGPWVGIVKSVQSSRLPSPVKLCAIISGYSGKLDTYRLCVRMCAPSGVRGVPIIPCPYLSASTNHPYSTSQVVILFSSFHTIFFCRSTSYF